MRNSILAVLAVAAAGAATMAGSGPAAAYDYPWCAQGKGFGIPGDCSYQSLAQCQASASGRNLYCSINPRAAFAREAPERPYGDYQRRRYYRDY